jgi:hypothetical protein
MTALGRLPYDALEVLLGHVDEPTLRSCAVAHRFWTEPSQRLLFSAIRLNFVTGPAFARALNSNRALGGYVRTLVCDARSGCLSLDAWVGHDLVALERLELCDADISQSLLSFVLSLASLRKLVLRRCAVTQDIDYELLLHAIPPLQALELRGLRGGKNDKHAFRAHTMLELVNFTELHSLMVTLTGPDECELVRIVLASNARLRELRLFILENNRKLEYPHERTSQSRYHPTKLTPGTVMRKWNTDSIHILSLSATADDSALPLVFGCLRETAFPRLRHLTVGLYWGRSGCRDGPLFEPFGSQGQHRWQKGWVLSPTRAKALSSVKVDVEGPWAIADSTEFLKLFGEANRPGVLEVDWHGSQRT